MLTVNHPWHGAHYGDKAPEVVNGLIEIPQGSRAKYEVDKATGLLRLDRVIYSSFHYPINYGFIPKTLGQDGDPLDLVVLCSQSIQSLCLVEAKVIGNMQMIDQGQQDDKIIAVLKGDKVFQQIAVRPLAGRAHRHQLAQVMQDVMQRLLSHVSRSFAGSRRPLST